MEGSKNGQGHAGADVSLFQTRWKFLLLVQAAVSMPVAWVLFQYAGIPWGKHWRLIGVPIIQKHRNSTILIGSHLNLRSTTQSNPLAPTHPVFIATRCAGAQILIGDHFAMTGGTLCAAESIQIGDRVAVGANVLISDTDFHPLHPSDRLQNPQSGKTKPVIIEDDVFIGTQSILLKGVTVGRGSVIGAGSIVTRDIPPGVIAAGNPANVISELG